MKDELLTDIRESSVQDFSRVTDKRVEWKSHYSLLSLLCWWDIEITNEDVLISRKQQFSVEPSKRSILNRRAALNSILMMERHESSVDAPIFTP